MSFKCSVLACGRSINCMGPCARQAAINAMRGSVLAPNAQRGPGVPPPRRRRARRPDAAESGLRGAAQ